MEWAILPLKRYAEFTGRSRRKEYWMFALLTLCAAVVLYFLDDLLGLPRTMGVYGPLFLLFEAAVLVPSIAVGIRRLHDTDRSGWWLLIFYGPVIVSMLLPLAGVTNLRAALAVMAISLIGLLVLFILFVLDGTRGPNRYGPDPKEAEGASGAA
jgi:uncharacterized membrane protein YhaH (DUF805 family)